MPGDARQHQNVVLRASPALRRRMDDLAKARGVNRSQAITQAVMEASTTKDQSPVPSEGEVLELLGEAARAGSVSAMKELRIYHRERSTETEEDPLSEFDELAQRRGA